jgi:hypothetical protein
METILAKGKFVILEHQGKGPTHFDLILEGQALCPTFQFEQKELISGKRIQDHRKNYLTFEGQISPEKGIVSQIDAGNFIFADNQLTLLCKKKQLTLICKQNDITLIDLQN